MAHPLTQTGDGPLDLCQRRLAEPDLLLEGLQLVEFLSGLGKVGGGQPPCTAGQGTTEGRSTAGGLAGGNGLLHQVFKPVAAQALLLEGFTEPLGVQCGQVLVQAHLLQLLPQALFSLRQALELTGQILDLPGQILSLLVAWFAVQHVLLKLLDQAGGLAELALCHSQLDLLREALA